MGLQFDQVVVHDQRLSGAQVLDRQLAEVRQTIMADDVDGSRRSPVSANGKTVLVRIHVGVGTTRHCEMLAEHARSDRENGIGIAAYRRFLGGQEIAGASLARNPASARVARSPPTVSDNFSPP
jgi:hypothetical protein